MSPVGPAPRDIDYEAAFREFESHPLFMRDLPDDPSTNEGLQALQSLIYEEEPDGSVSFFLDLLSCDHFD
jgi:hypothetical protein